MTRACYDLLMLRLALALSLLVALGCTPPYGQQVCRGGSDCSAGFACDLCNTGGDAGAGVAKEGLCVKPCTADLDCGGLGLKKPVCASTSCGEKHCLDSPF